jgi:hypothetical protein
MDERRGIAQRSGQGLLAFAQFVGARDGEDHAAHRLERGTLHCVGRPGGLRPGEGRAIVLQGLPREPPGGLDLCLARLMARREQACGACSVPRGACVGGARGETFDLAQQVAAWHHTHEVTARPMPQAGVSSTRGPRASACPGC